MITEYCLKALEKAQYRQIDDGSWFADIPGFTGVWANGASVEDCRKELIEVLEEWLILKLRDKEQTTGIYWPIIRRKTSIHDKRRSKNKNP